MDPRIQIEVAVTTGIPAAPHIESTRFLQPSEIRTGTGDTLIATEPHTVAHFSGIKMALSSKI